MLNFRNLNKDEIEVRVGTVAKDKVTKAKMPREGMQLLLYQDSRAAMVLLDETVGPENWQRKHEFKDGKLYCAVGIRIDRPDGTADWVWKEDVGTESNTEAEKGQSSDSFKRASVNWGVGRALYNSPFIWVKGCEENDKFEVEDIQYEGQAVTKLKVKCIKGERKGVIVFEEGYDKKSAPQKDEASELDKTLKTINKTKQETPKQPTMTFEEALKMECESHPLSYWYKNDKTKIDALRRTGNAKMKQAIAMIDEEIKKHNANKGQNN